MKINFVLPLMAALLFGCLPGQTPNQIIVDGQAALKFEPDSFTLNASLRSRSETQQQALEAFAGRLSEIRETLPNLDGLTHLTIDASLAQINPIQNSECMQAARYSTEGQCRVEGYYGSVSLTVTGSPASVSGHALSLLSELGAESVALSSYSLSELESAQQEAMDAAVKDAHIKAKKIAAAAGSTLIGPIRIQYGDGFRDDGYGRAYADVGSPGPITVAGARVVRPETDLDLDPQPIKIEAKVVAAFEIE